MISVESGDIEQEYQVLLNELRTFNPELLDKKRLLAITKTDLIDEELENEIRRTLPKGLPVVFISSITQKNIMALKDLIWQSLNEE
jgi:GTP-binding protein